MKIVRIKDLNNSTKKIKLSIIIPIYNSEKYLINCIDSICKQAQKNIELILIDDGSKDQSIKICKKYVKKFSFIKLIDLKRNRGVSYARNIAIRSSLGEFICFLDSDDVLLPGSINNFLNHIKVYEDYNLFVIRNFVLRKKTRTLKYSSLNLAPNERGNSILYSTNCWNFIIKKNFLKTNNIFFKNLKVTEDWVFVAEMLCNVKKYKIIKKPGYMHRMYEPNTLGKKTGYLIAISRLKVIAEFGRIISKKNIYLDRKKTDFLKRLLKISFEQMYSNLILCNTQQIKNISEYLKKHFLLITKLSKLNFKKFDIIFKNKKNIKSQLIEYKFKSYKKLKKVFEKNKEKNIIVFCVGGYGKTALKILLNAKAKIDFIVDNNPMYHEKKVDQLTIKGPLYLQRNINKLYNLQIFICNKEQSVFRMIKLQLKKIGFEERNIIHFNM
jgi:glycosyltransferase involved in cell wall biosynthesis